MLEWKDVKNEITALDDVDKIEINFKVELVGTLIKRRVELGLTQTQLAEMAGIKQSALARLEGLHATPKLDTIYKLLTPLGLKLSLVPK